jgi:hypothetical protein
MASFVKRNATQIRLARASRQEAARFDATSAKSLTIHFASIEKIIKDNDVDADRIFNLDEVGAAPGKDVSGRSREKTFTSAEGRGVLRAPEFLGVSRVAMVPAVSASGWRAPNMFIFKAKTLPYRVVSRCGQQVRETLADCLPRGSIMVTQEDVAGVFKHNFLQ